MTKIVGKDWRRQWNLRSATFLRHIDDARFGDDLCQSLAGIVPFRHSVIFGYPADRRPLFLHDGFSTPDRAKSVSAYIRGTYLVDPFYDACKRGIPDGAYRMEALAPDEFYHSVGSHPGYVSPCVSAEPGILSEEIGFFAACGNGGYVVLSLMRDSDEPPFSETEMERLREVSGIVCSSLDLRYRTTLDTPVDHSGVAHSDLSKLISGMDHGSVTRREAQVADLIMRGNSTEAISSQLGIAISTVKIHRRNLYEKLGVKSQAELFALILSRILDPQQIDQERHISL